MRGLAAVLLFSIALFGEPGLALAQDRAFSKETEALFRTGGDIYRTKCAKCHGRDGEGQRSGHDSAPRLAGNFVRLAASEVASQVIKGGAYMPPFGDLSDREIAAVVTYVRNSFGNDLGPVSEQDIAEQR